MKLSYTDFARKTFETVSVSVLPTLQNPAFLGLSQRDKQSNSLEKRIFIEANIGRNVKPTVCLDDVYKDYLDGKLDIKECAMKTIADLNREIRSINKVEDYLGHFNVNDNKEIPEMDELDR